jgi:hypothetical protein
MQSKLEKEEIELNSISVTKTEMHKSVVLRGLEMFLNM